MKKKYLTLKEFQDKFSSSGKIEFDIKSPFDSISISKKTLFFAWHWDQPVAITGTTGTAYVCRIGDRPYKFDFDVLSFRLDENGIPAVFHAYTDYHHTNEIPMFMKDQIPNDIRNKIKRMENNRPTKI